MKTIFSTTSQSELDSLKYIYSFMRCKSIFFKECSFLNPNPKMFDGIHVAAMDTYSESYDENNMLGWKAFKSKHTNFKNAGIVCVGSLDKKDENRVTLGSVGADLIFNCLSDAHEEQAKIAFDEIIEFYKNLTEISII